LGYKDDFYVAANIIGYSGNINWYPTVYFQTPALFGHITQSHGYSQNVGRQAVESAVGYTIGNQNVGGQMKLVESMNGHVFHESRSTLTAVNPGILPTLQQAIQNYPEEKLISEFSKKVQDTIADSESVKDNAFKMIIDKKFALKKTGV
jgi:hypothetical protein